MGTTYGAGDGSTTFNVPDKTGRASVMKEASATRLTSTFFGGNSTVLGAVGGSESHTLTSAQLAAHSHANTLTDPGHFHTQTIPGANGVGGGGPFGFDTAQFGTANTGSKTTGITITNASAGTGNAHNNVQPTIVCNYIMRII
jgi:microcystin-dependent protein